METSYTCTYLGSAVTPQRVTIKTRTHAEAMDLARRMCVEMRCKIYVSDADKPQDGWFLVSTEPFEEK